MTKNTSFKIPNTFLSNLDYLVYSGLFESRGEAIRIAIEDYIFDNYSFIFDKAKNECKVNENNKKMQNELFT